MALRLPTYVDTETLLALAEYHDVEVPRQADIVEKTKTQRSAGGKAGIPGVGADGRASSDVEYQSTYQLTPNLKATVSKVIDALIRDGAVTVSPGHDATLAKDDVVELDGAARITSASVAGKLLYIMKRVLTEDGTDLNKLVKLTADHPAVAAQLKDVYLGNELLPIPVLLEMSNTTLAQRVYVNVRPGHFVDAASADRLEGEFRVLGAVTQLVPDGTDGYLSSEDWLLHGWEYLFRRMMMATVSDQLAQAFTALDLKMPDDDVQNYIAGPAIIVDAIAIY